ncbi:peptidase S26 [Bradyrhizobium sp. SSBR45G]|uniref:S26 family signal peptidase n=1 Tax=unclassified Bradyrhizobium TaxID=2631580 RepID=UPI002342A52C|nr:MULTISPECIES: S26 family signal peptidase [unclassified Bradyrhizobium]GLH77075.1 peptidase S26 [Bradyrhizobium sp. SSBR45G]GLH83833.1 peptidase S26 [Bradyrhizobium sp. SSBR45R]
MTRRLPIVIAVFAGVSLMAGAGQLRSRPLFIWNVSESVPIGLYAVQPVRQWYVTELVVVLPQGALAEWLADGGYLPKGVPMLKRILALPGQTVCRREHVIIVDDVEVGVARESDSRGRPLPDWHGCLIISDGQVFLMNWQSDSSLDGRYFGLTATSDVIGRAVPVWTREP